MNNENEMTISADQGPIPGHLNDGLVKGGLYGISIDSPPTRTGLVTSALMTNLERGIHCTLITPMLLEDFFRHTSTETLRYLLQAIERKQLCSYSMTGPYETNIFRYGATQFLAELESFETLSNSLLIIDQADLLFTTHDPQVAITQAGEYHEWVRKTRNIALFLFLHHSTHSPTPPYLKRVSDHFNGLANLNVGPAGLEFLVEFWQTPGVVLIAKRMLAATDVHGSLTIEPSLAVDRRAAPRSLDTLHSVKHCDFSSNDSGYLRGRPNTSTASTEEVSVP